MVDAFKRPAAPAARDAKRARMDESGALVLAPGTGEQADSTRTSGLQAPIMLLTGHEGEIYAARFSPDGRCLASVGYDQRIFLWDVYGDCENFSVLRGHTGAIMDVHFNADASHLFTCATDKTTRVWDMDTGACLRKFKNHTDFVNSCHPARRGPELICSGGDDGLIIVQDLRDKDPAFKFENANQYQVTAVTFTDTAEKVISGGIDNVLKIWDLRRGDEPLVLAGHTDTITGIALSPDGSHVLSNSMDCTGRIWDVRPYAPEQRCVKVFTGHQHNFEKNLMKCAWSPDSHRISCGSSDRFVYVYEVGSRRIAYKLPGHQGSVNVVDFHPKEPILLSAGSDKRIYLGELDH
ncbi:Biotin/lipoate A/B protein ligase family protein [Aphelenchoides avenae]|nr:Biotin/lipoate A/B protein ligase family protein [Aphelenchus avenae]